MKTNNFKHKQSNLSSTIAAVLLTGLVASAAQAGKIVSELSAPPVPPNPGGFVADGFGGWNFDNVEIVLDSGENDGDDSWFNDGDGSYYFSLDSDLTYLGKVYDDVFGAGDVLGYVLAKDWPVGEPSGIKIVNNDPVDRDPKPQNCIMATSYLADHFLDSTDPQQVLCSGPFQSHKRYKLAMLPTAVVDGAGAEKGIDLVFNVVAEAGSRDYQVFQKINNWTDGRLEGFTIQVGTGIGSGFTPASDATNGVGVENLSLSVPSEIWAPDQLANFSAGLFGPADPKHDRDPGYFDRVDPAGFWIAEYRGLGDISGQTDTLTSGGTLGSDYAEAPTGATNQFGPWLADNMLPYGIFWDDDGNPETDAELLAWYGWNPNLATPALGWMEGASDEPGENFATVSSETITGWGNNLEYTQGEIDDLVNVGLNYIVTVGDESGFGGYFTIRITPKVDTSGAGIPEYADVPPVPSLQFQSEEGIVTISPQPEFVIGELLTLRVGDANAELPVEVTVTSNAVTGCTITGTGGLTETVGLIDQGEVPGERGVYAATTDLFEAVTAGTIVTVIYSDADDGDVETSDPVLKCASSEAIDPPVAILSDVSITDTSVPSQLTDGKSRNLKVSIVNAKGALESATGTIFIKGSDGFDESQEFTDLKPNGKFKASFNWTANLENPEEEETVEWIVTVKVNAQLVDEESASTLIEVKKGKNSKK